MSKKIQRPISILTSITTVAWLSGIVMLAPLGVGAAIVDGDIVSPDAEFVEGDVTYYPYDVFIVKIVGDKTFKRLILNPTVFDSYGHLEWGNIQTISAATVDGYVTSDLVRELDDTKVYKLTADGDVGTKGWVNMTAAEFESEGYDWDAIYVINVTDRDVYTTGSDVVVGGVVSEGTQLSVALAADTPAAGLAVAYEIRCPFTKINLTASSDGDITVDKVVVQRAGAGIDSDFDHLVLIDADTNLQIGLRQTLNNLHQSTFNDDFVVPAGTTKSIILGGNIKAGTPAAGNVPALSLVEIALKGDSVVNGTLPITGNAMTINTGITLGQVTVQNGAYENATTTSLKIGQTNYTISAIKVSANSTEDQNLEQIKFYQRGTAALGSDISNFKLLLDDSTDLGATITVDGKYVVADFSDSPLAIAKGLSKELSLKADVLDGSLRTIQMGIYRTTDVLARGVSNSRYRVATYSGTGSNVGTIAFTSPLYTISTGTLRIDRGISVGATNVAPGDDVVIGAFDFIVAGEAVNITEIILTFSTATTNGIKNVKVVDSTGSAIWGPDDVADGAGTVTFSSTASLPVGTNVLTVKATLQAHSFATADETFYVSITASNITATGVTTGDAITATPSTVSASTMTVKVGALAVSRDALPTAGNVVLGQQDFLYGSWTLDATNSGENVRVTAIKIGNRAATTTNNDALTLYDMSVTESECTSEYPNGVWSADYGCSLDPVKDGSSGTTTFSLTNPIIVTKGASKNIQLRADVRTTADGTVNHTDEFMLYVDGTVNPITAIGVSTGGSITASGSSESGALMAITAAGTLTINLDSATPSAKIVAAGDTAEIARIKLTASNEAINVTQLILNLGDGSLGGTAAATSDDVTTFYLYKVGESTAFASGNIATGATTKTFNITKGVLQVPKDTTAGLVIVVKAKFAGIGTGQTGTSGADVTVGLGGEKGIKGYGVASGTEASETYTLSTSSAMVLHLSRPTVNFSNAVSGAAGSLIGGAVMFDFNVVNDTSEPIALYQLYFWTATSGDDDLNVSGMYLQAKLSGDVTYSKIGPTVTGTDLDLNDYAESVHFDLCEKDDENKTEVPYVVPGGDTARIQLIAGTVAGLDADVGGTVNTYLLGDTATSTAAADLDEINGNSYVELNQGNFVWSDLHANNSTHYGADSNATTTVAQWWNGYLVHGLQATSSPQTLRE
jgi:hypothetical protein